MQKYIKCHYPTNTNQSHSSHTQDWNCSGHCWICRVYSIYPWIVLRTHMEGWYPQSPSNFARLRPLWPGKNPQFLVKHTDDIYGPDNHLSYGIGSWNIPLLVHSILVQNGHICSLGIRRDCLFGVLRDVCKQPSLFLTAKIAIYICSYVAQRKCQDLQLCTPGAKFFHFRYWKMLFHWCVLYLRKQNFIFFH